MADNPVGSRVKGLSLGLGAIDTVAVSLRLLARSQSKASFGADDFAIVFSLIPLYCMIAIGYLGTRAIASVASLLIKYSCGPRRNGLVCCCSKRGANLNFLEGTEIDF